MGSTSGYTFTHELGHNLGSRLRSSQNHFTRGRQFYAEGLLNEALIELQLAEDLNPADSNVRELLNTVQTQLLAGTAVSSPSKTDLEVLIERSRTLRPPGFDLPADVRLPASLTFRDASSRDIYTAIARFADVSLVFDPQFRVQPVTIELRNAALEEALAILSTATGNFYQSRLPSAV